MKKSRRVRPSDNAVSHTNRRVSSPGIAAPLRHELSFNQSFLTPSTDWDQARLKPPVNQLSQHLYWVVTMPTVGRRVSNTHRHDRSTWNTTWEIGGSRPPAVVSSISFGNIIAVHHHHSFRSHLPQMDISAHSPRPRSTSTST